MVISVTARHAAVAFDRLQAAGVAKRLCYCKMSATPFVDDRIINGKAVAAQIRAEVAATVKLLQEKHGKVRGSTQHTPLAVQKACTQQSLFSMITRPQSMMQFLILQVPGLAVVIVGERKDSQTYVRMKKKACEEVGIASFGADLPDTSTQQEVLDVVASLNANPDVHGILVQLPVSKPPQRSCLQSTTGPSQLLCIGLTKQSSKSCP